jgi:hypothetical protein
VDGLTMSHGDIRFVFTVCAGRSGQVSFGNLVNDSCPDALAMVEAPIADNNMFNGRLGRLEKLLRRKFIHTHELLGRGKIIPAFEEYDDDYITRIARQRLTMAGRDCRKANRKVYVDISKFFARGLHVGFLELVPRFSLVLLVRDPVLNMRSFLNRGKDFYLDNNHLECKRNILQLRSSDLTKPELYLWAWFEQYLRAEEISQTNNVHSYTTIRNTDLTQPDVMAGHLGKLGLEYTEICAPVRSNTNVSRGFSGTTLIDDDVRVFNNFLQNIPLEIRQRIPYLDNYCPTPTD